MSTLTFNDFIIDIESLGSRPDAIAFDVSVVYFNPDPNVVQTFEELVSQGKKFKLSIASQKGIRTIMPETIAWWKQQSPEALAQLTPSESDITVEECVRGVLDFLKENKVFYKKSQGWARGPSFDFALFVDMMRQTFKVDYTQEIEPIVFWQQRDIRTAIEAYSLVRGTMKTPLRKGLLDGFVHHDSIHDCAKDVLMLKTAQRYAYGLEQMPAEEDCDPSTMKKKWK